MNNTLYTESLRCVTFFETSKKRQYTNQFFESKQIQYNKKDKT